MLGGDDAMPPTSSWDKYFVVTNFVAALALGLSLFRSFLQFAFGVALCAGLPR